MVYVHLCHSPVRCDNKTKTDHLSITQEELKKVPYEEEMELCSYLVNYLTTTFLDKDKNKDKIGGEKENSAAASVAVTDDPFAGMTATSKKNDEIFLQMGSGKNVKKNKKGGKNKNKAETKWSVR